MSNVELKGFKKLRGLNSLLETEKTAAYIQSELASLSINSLEVGKYQPRHKIENNDAFRELTASIKEHGVIQPLIVREILDSGRFEIIAGERRWRAAQAANLPKVPAIIRNVDDNTALAFALIENIQRQDLNPIEEALALKRLLEEFSMTHEEVANSIGRSRAMVSNTLRLLHLTDPVKAMLIDHKLDMGHARALLSLLESKQIEAANAIIEKRMTVREAEAYIRLLQSNPNAAREKVERDPKIVELEEELCELLGARTKIHVNAKGRGKLICHFSSLIVLEEMMERLRNE